MAKPGPKTPKEKDEMEDLWFSRDKAQPAKEEKMPNFQFFDDTRRTVFVIGSILGVFIFAGMLWLLYYQRNYADPEPPPLIEADPSPIKTRPLDPGGMEVPDQDKEIFNVVSGTDSTLSENVQPSAEEPVEADSIEDIIRETEPEGTRVTNAAPPTAGAGDAAEGVYVIQLGAFGERQRAEDTWQILANRYKNVIGKLTPDIQEATLSGGQVLYRVRAGFFAERAQAENMCRRLKELGQDCLVAAR